MSSLPAIIDDTQDLDWLRSLIWVTRTGREVKICDMSNRHLENAIRYIDRLDWYLDERLLEAERYLRLDLLEAANTNPHIAEVYRLHALHVKDRVMWVKLCREGMKLEQYRREAQLHAGWGPVGEVEP